MTTTYIKENNIKTATIIPFIGSDLHHMLPDNFISEKHNDYYTIQFRNEEGRIVAQEMITNTEEIWRQ
jgi:hypothetical protein